MKKIVSIFIMIFTLFILVMFNNYMEDQPKEIAHLRISKESLGRQFIILDSIKDPLPNEAESVHYMEQTGGPQFLPNSQSKDPIIITKTPLPETNNLQKNHISK